MTGDEGTTAPPSTDATPGCHEALLEAFDEGVFRLDDDRFAALDDTAAALLGSERAELAGERVTAAVADEDVRALTATLRTVQAEHGPTTQTVDVTVGPADERTPGTVRLAQLPGGGVGGTIRRAAERRPTEDGGGDALEERANRLERQRATLATELEEVYDRVTDAVLALDTDLTVTYVNERAETLLERRSDDVVGEYLWDVFPHDETTHEALRQALETQEARVEEGYYAPLESWFESHIYPSETGLSVYFRDVTERRERERDLERYETIVETVWDGVYALDEEERFVLVNDAFCELVGYDREELLGEHASLVHSEELNATARELSAEVARGERDVARLELELRTADGDTVPVESRFGPYPDGESSARRMGVSREITERRERERELRRHRQQLRALNELNTVVQGINVALVRQSSREEIEDLVCEHLAASDAYTFAWIGDVDEGGQTVRLRTEAGVEGYLDGLELAVEGPDGQGPTGTAVRTGEVRTVQDVFDDPDYERWRNHAEEYGFRSSAAIPIAYEGTLYGVLNVYADRVDAFTGQERLVVARLGEIIGHAIRSIEQKQALLGRDTTVVEFRLPSLLQSRGADPLPDGTTATLDRTISVGDGTFLQYATVPEDASDAFRAFVEALPNAEIERLGDDFGDVRFEVRDAIPPVVPTVAEHGGSVRQTTIVGGDLRVTAAFPGGADIRSVVERIRSRYPDLELVAQRRDPDEGHAEAEPNAAVDLTDRQRAAMEAAYFGGYFEWPRDRTGEDLASSLGIAAPTFHQHLREAERKLLQAFLGPGSRLESVPRATNES